MANGRREPAWDAARTGVYLAQHLKTFCDVLDIRLNAVADKVGRPLSNLSRLFATGAATPEWYAAFDGALPALVEEARVRLKSIGGISADRIDEAARLIEGGCERRVRTLMLLGESPLPDLCPEPPEDDAGRRRLVASLLQSRRFPGAVSEDEAVFEIARKPFPFLKPGQIGFVYHMLGDAVMEAAGRDSDGHSQARRLYRKSVEHNASALVNDYVQLVRCHMRAIRYEGDLVARDRLEREVRDLAAKFDILSRVVPIPHVLVAEEYKAHAEWLEKIEKAGAARIADAFSSACRFFEQALSERVQPGGRTPEDADAAHLRHNVGYCHWMAGRYLLGGGNAEPPNPELRREADARFEKAGPHLEQALRIGALLDDAAAVAYNLKHLALLHSYQGHVNLAHWCIRASVAVYRNSRTRASAFDIDHAEQARAEIEAVPPTAKTGLRPASDDFRALAAEYFKKARHFGRVAGGPV